MNNKERPRGATDGYGRLLTNEERKTIADAYATTYSKPFASSDTPKPAVLVKGPGMKMY